MSVSARAQEITISLRVPADAAAVAAFEGNCRPQTQWSFVDSLAGVVGLGGRVENFEAFAANGEPIATRKLAPGQYSSALPATRVRYEVILAPPVRSSDSAKISWMTSDRGLLMLRDLLPALDAQAQAKRTSITLRLTLPSGWNVYTGEKQIAANTFVIADPDLAVFAAGNQIRSSSRMVSASKLNVFVSGIWAFTDAELLDLAAKVFSEHREAFGLPPAEQANLILVPYPQTVRADSWTAETRGSTVTLLMGKVPSKVGALAQLSTPLTHEFFHLWVPNGLGLKDDYDWFYEGFTVYQAARTAVRLDLLTFPEFLTAIGRAYDGYLNGLDRDRWSLVEASKRRWTVGQPSVYSKSMVVALLYDLQLRSESRGKRSLDNVYRGIFRDYRLLGRGTVAAPGIDGNEAVMSALAGEISMRDFVRTFVGSPTSISLRQELAPFGLTVETLGLRTRVSVSEKLTRQQRDLLRQLGYNDAVRAPRRSQKN